jgi:pantetheine-phosphate adenylyltransferase
MALTNSRLFSEIETVILLTPPALADVSSSTVRELHAFGRDVQEMMPQGVNIEDYME